MKFFYFLFPCVAMFTLSISGQTLLVPIDTNNVDTGGVLQNTQPIEVTDYTFAIRFTGKGADGFDSDGVNAGSADSSGSLDNFTNTDTATITSTQTTSQSAQTFGIQLNLQGGKGGDSQDSDAKFNAGAGGSAGNITGINQADITLSGSTFQSGLIVWESLSLGGDGGDVTPSGFQNDGQVPQFKDGGLGGQGGETGFVSVTNTGHLIAGSSANPLAVETQFMGIHAGTVAGNPGEGARGISAPNAGAVTVQNSGSISLYGNSDSPFTMYGIRGVARGGAGASSFTSEDDGGWGGDAGAVTINVTEGGDISLGALQGNVTEGAGIWAQTVGGSGGSGYDNSKGGRGGLASQVSVSVEDVTIKTEGDFLYGIAALSQGGQGGANGIEQDGSAPGYGGPTGGVSVSLTANSQYVLITTQGESSTGILAYSVGGDGGPMVVYDTFDVSANGGQGGMGADGGAVNVSLSGVTLSVSENSSRGLEAVSQGGFGGDGVSTTADSNIISSAVPGDGGAGGAGGAVQVNLADNFYNNDIQTYGDQAIAILAASQGREGGKGGDTVSGDDDGGAGGRGGDGGAVTLTVSESSHIQTQGTESHALVVASLSGSGGDGGSASDSGGGAGGDGGDSGNTGDIKVNVGGRIATQGEAAKGILVQNLAGIGGDAGDVGSVFYSVGGDGGNPGVLGQIEVDLSSSTSISTSGEAAHAILLQSISGGGGSAGQGGGLDGIGGAGGQGGGGGSVLLQSGGTITTTGENALGMLVQSVGGGGGDGGAGKGFDSLGGSGGRGGDGGFAQIQFAENSTDLHTVGDLSHGVVNQSIGGGGGNAGNATSVAAFVSLTIGGSGGDGGQGSTAMISGGAPLEITTEGSNTYGVLNQSVGGGGGVGGNGFTNTIGVGFSGAMAVGGVGGSGGDGGASQILLSDVIISTGANTGGGDFPPNALPVDSYGIVAHSIGGGGGAGGSSLARALTISAPIPETGVAFGISSASSVGGSGGVGGDGSEAVIQIGKNSQIMTQGQGSHALVAQSIGGGGGMGGDSSSSAATIGDGDDSFAVESNVSYTLGGQGGAAGSGGKVTNYVGGDTSGSIDGPVTITTLGDFSNGLMGQSIGGGGGNAGFGSSSTENHGAKVSLDVGLSLGASGGSGGSGGEVDLRLFSGSRIQTFGAGSHAILGQSIGGGGGASQGGALNIGDAASIDGSGGKLSLNVKLGVDGGTGSDAGNVTVGIGGDIFTFGGDSLGVLAQSIGGGGGLGGSAGGDASADFPIDPKDPLTSAVERVFKIESRFKQSFSAEFDLEIGGGGGEAADGGSVTINHSGSIVTLGDWSKGVLAQSIGGSGGKGGSALQTGSNTPPKLDIRIAAAGGGGEGGDGGSVLFALSPGSTVFTRGYAASGLVGQSIGGSGGLGADGTSLADVSSGLPGFIAVGADSSGNGGLAGNGGNVSLQGSGGIRAEGNFAHGVLLQSIGGGGGIGGQGSSFDGSIGGFGLGADINVGGGTGSGGHGGTVDVTAGSLQIQTSGSGAIGLLAQSIGGGGGLAFTPNPGNVAVGGIGSNGNGGNINITLQEGSIISTSGLAAHGILAQSIGGGGGLAGHPTSTPSHYLGLPPKSTASSGSGGNIAIDITADITTTGDGAHGIFAQTIGGGGGFRGYSNSVDMGSAQGNGSGGEIDIQQSGSISVSGTNSVGILAQQDGGDFSGESISVTINGDVSGGSGPQGYGAWLISKNTQSNTLTINENGSLTANSGVALRYDNFGGTTLDVINHGTLFGNIQGSSVSNPGTQSQAVTVNNMPSGRFFAGSMVEANINNSGLFYVGRAGRDRGTARTRVEGNFTQSRSGSLLFNADFGRSRSDFLHIKGNADFAGRVVPFLNLGDSILPDMELSIIQVDGDITGNLSMDGSGSTLFDFGLLRRGNRFAIGVTGANFAPEGLSLAPNQAEVSNHLGSIWDAGGTPAFGVIFAGLDAVATRDIGSFANLLHEFSPGATLAFGARSQASNLYFTNAVLNGPIFDGDTTNLSETSSGWVRFYGRSANQDVPGGYSNFRINTTVYQAGGQVEVAPDWFLGGSIAYQYDWMNGSNGMVSGEGDTALLAVTAKHQWDQWLFAAAATGSYGWYDTERAVTFPSVSGRAEGSPEVQTAGLALRAAYTHAMKRVYLRPMLTVNGIYARLGSYREKGLAPLDLEVQSSEEMVLLATPAAEVGARTDFDNGWILRSFLTGGVSFSTADDWKQQARFSGAPVEAGAFTTTIPIDQVTGRVAVAGELQVSERTTMYVQYEGEFSANLTSNGGSLGVKFVF